MASSRGRPKNRLFTWLRALLLLALLGWSSWQAVAFVRGLKQDIARRNPPVPAPDQQPDKPAQEIPDNLVIPNEVVEIPEVAPTSPTGPGVVETVHIDLEATLRDAHKALTQEQFVTARGLLNQALYAQPNHPQAPRWREQLSSMNIPIFLGPDIWADDPLARAVPIERGDTFGTLARRYVLPVELLSILNPQLRSDKLIAGQNVKIVSGPFHLRISRQRQSAELHAGEMFVCTLQPYFDPGQQTPNGTYNVCPNGKLKNNRQVSRLLIERKAAPAGNVPGLSLYGPAGPIGEAIEGRFGGVRFSQAHLDVLYLTLVDGQSLVLLGP